MQSNADDEPFISFEPESFSDPETRELAEILRKLGRFLPSGPRIDREESRRRDSAFFQELSRTERNDRLLDLLEGQSYEIGGDEHLLFRFESQPSRVYKSIPFDAIAETPSAEVSRWLAGKNFHLTR